MVELGKHIKLPTEWGIFFAYSLNDNQTSHLMLSFGTINTAKPVLIRVHSCCCFGDVFHGLSCDCHAQLHASIRLITSEGNGLIFYLNQEGRGVGLASKIEAICLEQQLGIDTVEAFSRLHYPVDQRSYRIVADTLLQMSIQKVRLLTNNPTKISALKESGLKVIREPLIAPSSIHASSYLKTKIEKMGHIWNHTLVSPESAPKKRSTRSAQ